MNHFQCALIPVLVLSFTAGCTETKKDEPASTATTAAATSAAATTAGAAAPAPTGAAAAAPAIAVNAGPSPSNDKEMLGLDLKPIGGWKPTWDADAKVAKWEKEDSLSSIVIRIVTDKLDTIDDL